MPFRSILFDEPESSRDFERQNAPDYFVDLNLDQVVESITVGRDEYDLKPFFYAPAHDVATINYRHDVLRDLENQTLLVHIHSFAERMRTMRSDLSRSDKLYYKLQKQSWFLHAVDTYCGAIRRLTRDIVIINPRSRGLSEFLSHLIAYTESTDFRALIAETEKLRIALSEIKYSLHIEGSRITVGEFEIEPDYGADILQTFERFKLGAPKEYPFDFTSQVEMNHVEAAILDRVTQLYPDIFSSLDEYCTRRRFFQDQTVRVFDREIQFYIACLEYTDRFKSKGLSFCYPVVSDHSKEICGRDVFDLALTEKLGRENASVVTNDFDLRNHERVIVVSGPNQGGKTTFARTFGQLHHLAVIGCPVPGKETRLYLFDRMFTHFEREEDLDNLSGKLEDDLRRIHQILEQATSDSIVIMNESFVSTTLSDALFLGKQIMSQIIARDMLCVSVTFLDELASLGDSTVSMVSTVRPEDTAQRTFKILRRPADGLAYAAAIAEKYHLTYESVRRRIAS